MQTLGLNRLFHEIRLRRKMETTKENPAALEDAATINTMYLPCSFAR